MEFISFAIPFAALVFLTVIVGGLMNYYMDQRGLAFNPYLTYLLLPAIVGALYFVGGVSMWTVKGIVLALILLRASVQDLSERQADEFLWVMLLILAIRCSRCILAAVYCSNVFQNERARRSRFQILNCCRFVPRFLRRCDRLYDRSCLCNRISNDLQQGQEAI